MGTILDQPAFHAEIDKVQRQKEPCIFNWHQPPMCKGSVLWKSKVDSVLGHEVVRLQRCTSDANHLMWASKFKTLVVFFSQHLTMICAPDARRSSLKLKRFGGLSLAAAFQFLLHKPIQNVPITCKWAGVTPPGSSGHVTQQLQTRTCPSAIVFWLASSRFFSSGSEKNEANQLLSKCCCVCEAVPSLLSRKIAFFSFACCCRSSQINQFRSSESNSDSTWSFT